MQPTNMVNQRQPIVDEIASTRVIQEVFSTMDEFAIVFKSMLRIFEGNANNEPPIDT